MEMPIILPRENFTVCQKSLNLKIESLEVKVDDILDRSQESLEKKILMEKDTLDVDSLFQDFSNKFEWYVPRLDWSTSTK